MAKVSSGLSAASGMAMDLLECLGFSRLLAVTAIQAEQGLVPGSAQGPLDAGQEGLRPLSRTPAEEALERGVLPGQAERFELPAQPARHLFHLLIEVQTVGVEKV